MRKKQHIDGLSSREYVRMLVAELTGLLYEEQEAIPRIKEVLDCVEKNLGFSLELGFFSLYSLGPSEIGISCSSRDNFGMREPSQLFYMTADYHEHKILRVVRKVIYRPAHGSSCIADQVVLDQTKNVPEDVVGKASTVNFGSLSKREQKALLSLSVNELELCVRAANCLNNADFRTLGQLVVKTKSEMLKYKNFGRVSLKQLESELSRFGLRLGMKLT